MTRGTWLYVISGCAVHMTNLHPTNSMHKFLAMVKILSNLIMPMFSSVHSSTHVACALCAVCVLLEGASFFVPLKMLRRGSQYWRVLLSFAAVVHVKENHLNLKSQSTPTIANKMLFDRLGLRTVSSPPVYFRSAWRPQPPRWGAVDEMAAVNLRTKVAMGLRFGPLALKQHFQKGWSSCIPYENVLAILKQSRKTLNPNAPKAREHQTASAKIFGNGICSCFNSLACPQIIATARPKKWNIWPTRNWI